jgi:hypothetical protein
MWAKIAEEMAVPWRAAEAMHWQLGEQDMAHRAGVVPFSFSSVALEPQPKARRASNPSVRTKRESQSQSQSSSHQLPSVAEVASESVDGPSTDTRPPESMPNSPQSSQQSSQQETPKSQSWGNSPTESLTWR